MIDTEQGSTFLELLRQAAAAPRPPAKRKRFDLRTIHPPGEPRPGSATEAVLQVLTEAPGLLSESQLIWKTGRTHSAVSWALLRLRRWGKVEAVGDARNPRWLRYRVVREVPSGPA